MRSLMSAFLLIGFLFGFNMPIQAQETTSAIIDETVSTEESAGALGNFIDTAETLEKSLGKKIEEETKKRNNDLVGRLESARISFKVNGDVKIIDGLSINLGYRYLEEPAYNQTDFVRIDGWNFDLKAEFGKLGTNLTKFKYGPFFEGIRASEMQFARLYPTTKAARFAMPILPTSFPISADRLDKLQVGDFASFIANMTLKVGIGAFAPIVQEVLVASGSLYALVQGDFQINIYKESETHVRVKLFAIRQKEKGIELSVGLPRNYEIYGASDSGLLDKGNKMIVKITHLTAAIQAKLLAKNQTDVLVADYTFAIGKDSARSTYDYILGKAKKYSVSKIKLLNPLTESDRLKELLVHDLEPVNDLARKELSDYPNNPELRSININFLGASKTSSITNGIALNLFLFRAGTEVKFQNNYLEKQVLAFDESADTKENYLFSTWVKNSYKNVLLSLGEDIKLNQSGNAIYTTDKNRKVNGFVDIGFYFDLREKIFSSKNQKELRNHIRSILPEEIYSTIDFGDFADMNEKRVVRARFEYYIHEEGLKLSRNYIKDLAKASHPAGTTITDAHLNQQINEMISAKVSQLESQGIGPDCNVVNTQDKTHHISSATLRKQCLRKAVRKMSDSLEKALYLKDYDLAVETFHKLRDNELFVQIGPAFLFELLPKSSLSEVTYFSLLWTAKGVANPAKATYGANPRRELYAAARCIDANLNNNTYDLKIKCEEDQISSGAGD